MSAQAKEHNKLGEIAATAICGNDISSSCLYVSALAVLYAGKLAFIALILVALVLFLFRRIYGEVVGALPLNGGAYNALLNTTSKNMASLAAALTILSYMATAVISGVEAMHYVHNLWHGLPVDLATILLLAFFMILTIMGISESAKVAIGIFAFHLFNLVLLTAFCGIWLFSNGMDTFSANWATPLPVEGEGWTVFAMALFFGFSAAMLGVSGFESSSNFVEEQEKGVFPKTLRNMWIVVSIFNPLMAFLALAVLPIDVINNPETQNALLAVMGGKVGGGNWLSILISVNAAMVLSGAVLTSFVGVSGLIERMTLDRIMFQFMLKKNKRGSSYWIMIIFFLLCASIELVTSEWFTGEPDQLPKLAGVYTISFLCVMALFGVGNILLKVKRSKLPRPEKANVFAVVLAIAAVITAIAGNIIMNPNYVLTFAVYFIPTILIIGFMLYRIPIFKSLLFVVKRVFTYINHSIEEIVSQEFVFFTKGDDVSVLNKVMIYITENENTRKLKIVTVVKPGDEISKEHLEDIEVLDRSYPEIKIEFIKLEGEFGPDLIERLSKKWNIPMNFMFIGSPGDKFPFRIEELGGVRLII